MRTGSLFVYITSFALSATIACKAQEKAAETEPSTDKPPATEPEPTPESVTDAQAPLAVGEFATTLLDTKGSHEAQWVVTDTEIMLVAEFTKGSEGEEKRDATVYATVGETEKTTVFECKAMLIAGEPRVDVLLRGDHMHVMCINPPFGENVGFTDAKRVTFDQAKMALTETGSYGGEGIVDPDTIDLDEGMDL